MNCRFRIGRLLLVLFFVQCASQSVTRCALAQEAGGVLYGRWTASSGPSQIFRGTWSAEISRQRRNEAQGSWTLVNDAGEVALEGTWSARKNGLALDRNLESSNVKGAVVFGKLGHTAAAIEESDVRRSVKTDG
jgi:hypothetical protein